MNQHLQEVHEVFEDPESLLKNTQYARNTHAEEDTEMQNAFGIR